MNRRTTDAELLAVLQAKARGEQIEMNLINNGESGWTNFINGHNWNLEVFRYRVKRKEPRTWRVAVFSEGIVSEMGGKPNHWTSFVQENITVREVL